MRCFCEPRNELWTPGWAHSPGVFFCGADEHGDGREENQAQLDGRPLAAVSAGAGLYSTGKRAPQAIAAPGLRSDATAGLLGHRAVAQAWRALHISHQGWIIGAAA